MCSLADFIIIIIIIIIITIIIIIIIILSQSFRTIHTDSKESSVSRAAWTAFCHSKVGFNVAFSSFQSSPIGPNKDKAIIVR